MIFKTKRSLHNEISQTMEDEEILPENSDLMGYLQGLGFTDVIAGTTSIRKENALNFENPRKGTGRLIKESIDADIMQQVGILLSGQMLFEEDVSNIEQLMSNFRVVKNGMLKNMFQDTTTVVIIILGLCLYWVIGGYVFILVSSFYAYRASDYLWRRHFNFNRLKNLIYILQTNYLLLNKTLRFIQENESILQSNYSHRSQENGDFQLFHDLREEFSISENEVITILSRATQKLIKIMPLCDYVENPQFYLCNKYKQVISESDASKLHQVYLLIQSEFLQRVVLTLIPNLQASYNSKEKSYQQFNQVLIETSFNLKKAKSKLNKKFKFVFLNGIQTIQSKVEPKKLPRSRSGNINYAKEFVTNIHDTSNTLQNLLIKSRVIENNFDISSMPRDIENELVIIQNDLIACQKNISDSFILLKKFNSVTNSEQLKKLTENKESECLNVKERTNQILVGYTDLDPKVDDEIFEAYFASENVRERDLDDDYDFEDKLKKRLEKEYSRKVLNELKTKLVEKAKDWKAREANIFRKKMGISDDDVNQIMDVNREINEEEKFLSTNPDCPWPLSHVKRCQIPRKNGRIVPSVDAECENYDGIDKEINEDVRTSAPYKVPDLNFLTSISEARKEVLTSTDIMSEELFCDSDESP